MEIFRVVDKALGVLSLADVRSKSSDFLIDRLSYKFTSTILCAFSLFCAYKSMYTVPIICWIPAQLRRYEKAITAYCYANNTYFIPENKRVPTSINERYESLIIYYQWLPWIFAIQAVSCCIPKLVWHFALSGSSYNVQDLLEMANKVYTLPEILKSNSLTELREGHLYHLNSKLFNGNYRSRAFYGSNKQRRIFSCYLIICYIGVKVLYLVNCLLQIMLIHYMIGTRPFSVTGYNHLAINKSKQHFLTEFMAKMKSGVSELIDTSSFPKRTLCDFTFRELASNHAYTVECLLQLNIIAEKMYVFLYLWFILVGFVTLLDLLKWIGILIYCFVSDERSLQSYVSTHLIGGRSYRPEDIQYFAKEYLTGDTYFLLRIFSKNISTFVVVALFDYHFKTNPNEKKAN